MSRRTILMILFMTILMGLILSAVFTLQDIGPRSDFVPVWLARFAATYVLGRITDDVIEPAFSEGIDAGAVWWAVAALILVAVLRGASVVVRRWYGSVTETRMQASLRRSVGERLLTMPMSSAGPNLASSSIRVSEQTSARRWMRWLMRRAPESRSAMISSASARAYSP